MSQSNKKIALFGASFNPPHLGHKAAVEFAWKTGLFDEIWIIPVFSHPHGKNLLDCDLRLEMIKLLISEVTIKPLFINTIEKNLGKSPCYSLDIVLALKEQHPDYHFTYILGSDAKKDMPNWYRIDELKKAVDFCYVPRKGYEDSKLPEVSSSQIREQLNQGKSIAGLTSKQVENYLLKHHLYKKEV